MIDPRFTDEETWSGGGFELSIVLKPSLGREQIDLAAEAAWDFPGLLGPFDDRAIAPDAQRPVAPRLASDRHLWGLATLPDGSILPFGSVGITSPGAHWLCLYFPFGALERMYDLDEPWESWARPLEEWFVMMARNIYRKVRFHHALIGEEVCGEDSGQFDTENLDGFLAEPVRRKGIGLLIAKGEDVQWYSATEW